MRYLRHGAGGLGEDRAERVDGQHVDAGQQQMLGQNLTGHLSDRKSRKVGVVPQFGQIGRDGAASQKR